MHRRRPGALLAVAAAALFLASAAAAGASAGPTDRPLVVPADTPASYAELNASQLQVVFGSPLPAVALLPRSNASPGAVFEVDHLLEIHPNDSLAPDHPLVVAEAAPQTVHTFNTTVRTQAHPGYVQLSAALPVAPTLSTLWAPGGALDTIGPAVSTATLSLNYSLYTGADGSEGVLLAWSVTGWPWVAPAVDQLALEFDIAVPGATGFSACLGTPSADDPSAHCPTAAALANGSAVWPSDLSGLEVAGPNGSAAWVSWSPSAAAAGASMGAGADLQSAGYVSLALVDPTPGASTFAGSALFLVSLPPGAAILGPVVADPAVYGGAIAGFAVASVAAVALYRRHDRAVRDAL